MERAETLTERIRDWYEHSPKAQRAYRRLSADLDIVADRVESATVGLREVVGPWIDPPPSGTPPAQEESGDGHQPEHADRPSGTPTRPAGEIVP